MTVKVAVLYGGLSEERDVSLRSGAAVAQALEAKGYEVTKIDVGRDVAAQLARQPIDVAYIALHGKYGEDGAIQGLLELMGIPYTGPGVMASAVCMNKIMTKRILMQAGLPTPRFASYQRYQLSGTGMDQVAATIQAEFSLPVVVKAPTQGSTIGIYFVNQWSELLEAMHNCLQYGDEVLIEEFVKGVELTASVLGNDNPQALTLIEITSVTGVYDYQAKYTVGMSEHIMPPRLQEAMQQQVKELAIAAYKTLNCRGLSRVDFIISNNKPYILEVNTSPGMTETSLFPDAAKHVGIEFADLVDRVLKLAME